MKITTDGPSRTRSGKLQRKGSAADKRVDALARAGRSKRKFRINTDCFDRNDTDVSEIACPGLFPSIASKILRALPVYKQSSVSTSRASIGLGKVHDSSRST
jgi:hypothetical protein